MSRPRLVAGVAVVAVVSLGGPALAWVSVNGATQVEVDAATLAAPSDLGTAASGDDLGAGRVRLSWSAPTGVDVTGWSIERATSGGSWTSVTPAGGVDCDAGSCSAIDEHGSPGTSYRYRVAAQRHAWTGDTTGVRMSASLVPAAARTTLDSSGVRGLGVGTDGVFAVGDDGLFLQCREHCGDDDVPAWEPVPADTTADLRAVDVVSGNEAWAVGVGTVLQCNDDCFWGDRWTPVDAAESFLAGRTATSVMARDDGYLALVVDGALAWSPGGNPWTEIPLGGPGQVLHAVTGKDGGTVVVTGAGGFVATCVVSEGVCDDEASFVEEQAAATFVAASWDAGAQTVVAVDDEGGLWAGTPTPTGTTWVQDAAHAGRPAGLLSAVARSTGDQRDVWGATPGSAGSAQSTLWHRGSAWQRQPTGQEFGAASLVPDGGSVGVPARSTPLTDTCTAPALLVDVDVPPGPAPGITPRVGARLTYPATNPGTRVRLLVSDGATWSPAVEPDPTATKASPEITGLAWDTTAGTRLRFCLMADADGFHLDGLQVGVQQ